jgi:hypothetical protein
MKVSYVKVFKIFSEKESFHGDEPFMFLYLKLFVEIFY